MVPLLARVPPDQSFAKQEAHPDLRDRAQERAVSSIRASLAGVCPAFIGFGRVLCLHPEKPEERARKDTYGYDPQLTLRAIGLELRVQSRADD
jgi:hypothetical protein